MPVLVECDLVEDLAAGAFLAAGHLALEPVLLVRPVHEAAVVHRQGRDGQPRRRRSLLRLRVELEVNERAERAVGRVILLELLEQGLGGGVAPVVRAELLDEVALLREQPPRSDAQALDRCGVERLGGLDRRGLRWLRLLLLPLRALLRLLLGRHLDLAVVADLEPVARLLGGLALGAVAHLAEPAVRGLRLWSRARVARARERCARASSDAGRRAPCARSSSCRSRRRPRRRPRRSPRR